MYIHIRVKMNLLHCIISLLLIVSSVSSISGGTVFESCSSIDCTNCSSFRSDTTYVTCGLNLTSFYTLTDRKELQFYYSEPGVCQRWPGGSYRISCSTPDTIGNEQLNTCTNGTMFSCEPGELVRMKCTDLSVLERMSSSQCPTLVYGICAHFRDNLILLVIAVCIFPLFLALGFSVYASLPCVIFASDGKPVIPSPRTDVIISSPTLKQEIDSMMQLDGTASPSTISEYSTSTFRGNSILTASCLMSSSSLLMLRFISSSVENTGNTHWIRVVCYLLISLVGFFPSAPPEKIRSRTPVLWCSFGNTCSCCGRDSRWTTSLIQNTMHILSFFLAIILWIVDGYLGTSRDFAIALASQLVILIMLQAPINLVKLTSIKISRRMLNSLAAGAFFMEVSLASCLICFSLYEELLPISTCVGISALAFYPWAIIVVACAIGWIAGVAVTVCQCAKCHDIEPI